MFARGAKTYHLELLRDLCRHLLADLQQHDPRRYEAILAQVDLVALFGAKGEKLTPALTLPERALRLQQVVNQALRLHAQLEQALRQAPWLPGEAEAELRLWLAAIDKVIRDETTLEPDPAKPGWYRVTERPHGKKGAYRHACANDLSASYRDHGRGQPPQIQYNNSVLASPHFIHEVEAATGATPDPVPLPGMLKQLHQQHGYFPPKVTADQIFGSGKYRCLVDQVSAGRTQLVALLPDYEKRTDRFVPSDFIVLEDGGGLTCPAGLTTCQRVRKAGADGDEYRFSPKLCQGCRFWPTPAQLAQNPQLAYCRLPTCKPNSYRDVFISDYRDYVLAAQAYNKTEQFKLEIRQRPLIERIIFNLTHFFGARYAKSTGLDKANFQLRMAATAFNLRQLVRRRGHQRTRHQAEAPLLPLPEVAIA
jgi:transposase